MGAPYPDIVRETSFRTWKDDLSILGSASLLGDVDPVTGNDNTLTPLHSYQVVGPDLLLGAESGKDIGEGTAFLAPIMGNVLGASLLETGNYLAGVIGAYSITGPKATHLQAGGVLGIIMDGVTAADAAIVAIIDGDGSQTRANAAFAVRMNNSVPGSGIDYGLDLFGAAHDGFTELPIAKAALRLDKEVCFLQGAGAPTNGTTGATFAEIGSLYIDRTNGNAYLNAGTKASPTWKLITRAP